MKRRDWKTTRPTPRHPPTAATTLRAPASPASWPSREKKSRISFHQRSITIPKELYRPTALRHRSTTTATTPQRIITHPLPHHRCTMTLPQCTKTRTKLPSEIPDTLHPSTDLSNLIRPSLLLSSTNTTITTTEVTTTTTRPAIRSSSALTAATTSRTTTTTTTTLDSVAPAP